jgi:hypothetical protein
MSDCAGESHELLRAAVQVLRTWDRAISLARRQMELLEVQKRFLVNDLLTGARRAGPP